MTRPSLGSFSLAPEDGKERTLATRLPKHPDRHYFSPFLHLNQNGGHFAWKTVMYQSNRSFNIPPPGNPLGIWIFGKVSFKFPPSPGWKAVQMSPPPGKLPDYYSNFSVASIMLLKLCIETWFNRKHIFIYYKYKSFLNTFKCGTQLV